MTAKIQIKFHGFDKNLGGWVEAQGKKIKQILDHELEEAIVEAAEDMIRILEAARTPTGEARAAAGGNGPGRVDTGTMRDAIKSRVLEKTPTRTVGAWGWLDEVLDYFVYQEYGGEHFAVRFAGMDALQGSYINARERFHARLRKIGKVI